jgi:hypothetical protein
MGLATLVVLCVAWLAVAATLSFRLIRPRPWKSGSQWMGSALLLIMSAAVISAFAHDRNWPVPRLLELDWLTMPVALIGLGCAATSVVIQIRSSRY